MSDDEFTLLWTCARVRPRLADLFRERLDERSAEGVRGHLRMCEPCGEALAQLIFDDVAHGTQPLKSPPIVPPRELYEAFLRTRKTRFGTLWKSVRDAGGSADAEVRAWGRAKREEITRAMGLVLSTAPVVAARPHALRTRGAVRARGARLSEAAPLLAEVVTSDSLPAGGTVPFTLDEPPRVEAGGRFRLRMHTVTPGYAGQVVLCTVELEQAERVSFTAILTRRPDQDVFGAQMDEEAVAPIAGVVPIPRVQLFITHP